MDRRVADIGSQPTESYCQIKLDALCQLEDGTKKLLNQLEQLKSKSQSHYTNLPSTESVIIQTSNHSDFMMPLDLRNLERTRYDGPRILGLGRSLDVQTAELEQIYANDYDFENFCACSIFNKLCRKCHCLKDKRYNDFVMHFNENSKYMTSTLGEVIKNVRILKKFLYMGGDYTKNAMTFLIEGLTESDVNEKLEIIFACSCADICNIFDESSIVTVYIIWPSKFKNWGDSQTQILAAKLLQKIAQVADGKDYLNLNSKIVSDLNVVLKKMSHKIHEDVMHCIHETLILLGPTITRNMNVTTYFVACKVKKHKKKKEFMNLKDFAQSLPSYTKPRVRKNYAGHFVLHVDPTTGKQLRHRRSKITPMYTEE